MEFSIHPFVYSTGNQVGLRNMLENTWVRNHKPGDGKFYIISGFANYNGGARFYRSFSEHIDNGGQIVAFLGGSASQRLSSKQVVEALLECGVGVNIINRKRLLHAKLYGFASEDTQKLVVSSGNFTGPGMSQNIEASVIIENDQLKEMSFSWTELEEQFHTQDWLIYQPSLDNLQDPGWELLYDESPRDIPIDESEETTLIVILGHADTARIQAAPGTRASLGSQYFWLSKDSFDFFPPLTIRNIRGIKGTLSAMITLNYIDLDEIREERVTFEAENNLDFRLGTGALRNSHLATEGDLACISRIGESNYQLRIIKSNNEKFTQINRYATLFVGHQGKRYGYIDNRIFETIMEIDLE